MRLDEDSQWASRTVTSSGMVGIRPSTPLEAEGQLIEAEGIGEVSQISPLYAGSVTRCVSKWLNRRQPRLSFVRLFRVRSRRLINYGPITGYRELSN